MRGISLRSWLAHALCVAFVLASAVDSVAQSTPHTNRISSPSSGLDHHSPSTASTTGEAHEVQLVQASAPPDRIGIRGFGLFGIESFSADQSFDAVLGSSSGGMLGGGVQVVLPVGFYAELDAWRFSADGERVFVGPGDEVFPLGISTEVNVTPLELTGGWRFSRLSRYVVPYAGAGVSWYRYKETADFADPGDDVDERFTGYHLLGGAEVRLHRWIHASGEVAWTSVPNAFGESGASAAFDEDNLGGTSIRFKILVGR